MRAEPERRVPVSEAPPRPVPEAPAAPARGCPRTKRTRAIAPLPGVARPSDSLTAFLAVGVGWMLAAAGAGVAAALSGAYDLRWLALHFAFVGGISQLVIGAGQFFACAFLATDPVQRRTVRAELALWNAAVVAIALGVPLGINALTGLGGALVLAGLVLFVLALWGLRDRSLQRAPWATRWYETAAVFLALGAALGPVMGGHVLWTHGSLLGAHMVLNIGGWFGTAIVGTLHTFYPSLTESALRRPRLQTPTYWAWCAGIAVLSVSAAFALDAGAIAGWALLLCATAMLASNLVSGAFGGRVRSPGAVLVSAAQLMLVGAVALGLVASVRNGPLAPLVGPEHSALAALLLGGWVGLTVAGSLAHLLTLMARVRSMPDPPPPPGFDVALVAGGGLALLGLLFVAAEPSGSTSVEVGRLVAAAGYALVLARLLALARRAVRASPLRV